MTHIMPELIEELKDQFSNVNFIVSPKALYEVLDSFKARNPTLLSQKVVEDIKKTILSKAMKISRGKYNIGFFVSNDISKVESSKNSDSDVASIFVPQKDKTFVKWGHFHDIYGIVASEMFYPAFIHGLSGNGKTVMVEQACAESGRKYLRLQVTPETDEDDLIGGFRLVKGETVFQKGPAIQAMEEGAVLLIDEIDRGTNRLMALQGILEGKPVLIKKTGEVVTPRRGFNIIATANTKGQGDESGRYIAANILDEAFLERFIAVFEQNHPSKNIETKILMNNIAALSMNINLPSSFFENLINWAQQTRQVYSEGGIEGFLSTRRLCHIIQTYAIFGDLKKAINICTGRYDVPTQKAFISFYEKIDPKYSSALNTGSDKIDDTPF